MIAALIIFSIYTKQPASETKIEVAAEAIVETIPEVVVSDELPSEEKPPVEYVVAANNPRSISIPAVGISGFIQKVGINKSNEIAVPNNIHFTGWYVNSVKPGEKGLSIIDGHVDGPSVEVGVFSNLNAVEKDQTFEIEYGDGSKVQFKVIEKIQVKVTDADKVLFSKRKEVESQLNLITCGGNYNRSEHRYEDRIIIVSEKIS